MKKLQRFKESFSEENVLKDSSLSMISGGLTSAFPYKSKYWCAEDTSEGTCHDTLVDIQYDYEDGSITNETRILT